MHEICASRQACKKPSKLAFCFCIRVDVLSSSHKHICPAASTASSADEVLLAASCLLSRKLLLILSQPLYASCIICYCMLSLGHELCHIGTHTSKKEHQLFTKLLATLTLHSARCLKITEKVSFNTASEASYVYVLSGQKLIKNAKNGPILRVFFKSEA